MPGELKRKGQINEIIKSLMKDQSMPQLSMAKAIRKQRANDVSARLMSGNMTVDRVIEMLDVLGYELVVQQRTSGNRGKDQILVTKSEPKKKGGEED